MLDVFRNSAKGNVGKVIVGLIVITFVFFGAESIISIAGNSAPATVNGEDISQTEFQRLMNSRQQELTSQFGAEAAAQLANSPFLREEIINSLINQRLQAQLTQNLNLEISDEQVLKTFAEIDAFLIDGEFDQNMYINILAANGFNHKSFVASQKAQQAMTQMQMGLVNSAFNIEKAIDRYASLDTQMREVSYQEFNSSDFESEVQITEEEMATHYSENESSYMSDEQVKVDYILVSLADLSEQLIITDSEIELAYNSYLAELARSETRVISHILFSDGEDLDSRAQAALDRLNNGESFEDLAFELSDDPGSAEFGGSLGELIPDVYVAEFYDAALSLAEVGEVSQPVQTQFGLHLIKLDSLSTASADSLVEKRDELDQQIRDRKGREEMLLVESQLSDEAFASDFIADVAELFQVEVESSDWLNRSGAPGVLSEPSVIDAAFSNQVINEDLISDVVRLSNGDLLALQKAEYQAEDVKPFELVEADITTALTKVKAQDLMTAAIENLVENQSMSQGQWSEITTIDRNNRDLPVSVVAKAFELNHPEAGKIVVGMSEGTGTAYAVAVLFVSQGDVTSVELATAEAFADQATGGSQYQVLFNQVKNTADIKIRQ